MKVMVVCTTGGWGRRQLGGAERMLVDQLPVYLEAGLDVVACTPDDEAAAALRDAGVPWINLGARRRVDLDYVRQLRRLVDTLAPDVVSAHLLSAAMHTRAALGVRHRRMPLVVAMHNSLWQYRDTAPTATARRSIQVNIALDLALRRLRPHISVAVSEFEADQLRTLGRVKDVRVLPNPLPATWPRPQPATAREPGSPLRVGFMARLERDKGADLLGDIARALPEASFRIAGAGEVAVPRLPNVELLGRVSAERFLPGLDCVIVPSRVESFGRTAIEALSLGVPVVHSGVGGLAEVTRHADGTLGFVTDLAPASVAAAVRAATSPGASPDTRLAIAEWYQREFAFSRAVERWIRLYRSVAHVN